MTPTPMSESPPSTYTPLTQQVRELLAAEEHERWSRWQGYLHSLCWRGPGGELVIPPALVERWERQIAMRYHELSSSEQASDMKEVDTIWPIIESYANAVSILRSADR